MQLARPRLRPAPARRRWASRRTSPREAVDEVFGDLDESALLARALARRLRGPARRIRDAGPLPPPLPHLVRQGFPPVAVIAALKARAKAGDAPDDEA